MQTYILSALPRACGQGENKPLVHLWDVRNMNAGPLRTYEGPQLFPEDFDNLRPTVRSLAIDSRQATLFCGGQKDITCWNLQTGEQHSEQMFLCSA